MNMSTKFTFAEMNIAVVASCLYDDNLKKEKTFVEDLLSTLANNNRKLKFFIITEKQAKIKLSNEIRFELISLTSPGKTLLQKKYWWEILLPRSLKKYKADLLISFDEQCSKSLILPQIIIAFDGQLSGLRNTRKARIITVNSEWGKKELASLSKIKNEKIEILSLAIRKTQDLNGESEKEKFKLKYCDGKEYFLSPGKQYNSESFIILLKAFSLFKKRQQSSMKLMLFSKPVKKSLDLFSSYKYREDIVILEKLNVPEEDSLISSSYAVLISQNFRHPVIITLKSMQVGIPVLALEDSPVREYAGEAALYFEKETEKDIAEKMIRIYADEKLRDQLISKGKEKVKNYTIGKAADQLWNCIQQTVK